MMYKSARVNTTWVPGTDLSDLFSFSFESVKEILDQLVEIDLVVNFRCTDDYLVKHQQGSFFSKSCEVTISCDLNITP